MTAIELARLACACRAAQRAYFAARRAGLLGTVELMASRAKERELDGAIADVLGGRTLFDRPGVSEVPAP